MATRAFDRRPRRWLDYWLSPTVLTLIGGVSVLAVGAVIALSFIPAGSGSFVTPGSGVVVEDLGSLILALSFTCVGVVVGRRQPRNPMGWLLIGVALAVNLGTAGPGYAGTDYGPDHGTLPLGSVAVLVSGFWLFLFMLVPLAVLMFPDGRLAPRWRWPLRAYLLLGALVFVGVIEIAVRDLGLRQPVDDQGNLIGLDHPHGWIGVVFGLTLVSSFVVAVAAIAMQAHAYRRATSERRQQLKWLSCGAVVCIASGAVAVTNPSGLLSNLLVPVGFALLPLSMGVGIMRYRLYEIDRLVSRTLSYAILTGLLAGTFIGLVALTTDVLPFNSRVAVAASTLVAAALFNPLRVRIQRIVDRRFNRARYDAEATVADFTARLRDAVEIDAIRRDLLDTVARAVHPTHASVWIKP